MLVVFREHPTRSYDGSIVMLDTPWQFNTKFYFKVLNMDKKTPISFNDAAMMCWNHYRFLNKTKSYKIGAEFFQFGDWCKFISDQGFHIELTGDEFEIIHEKQTVNQ